MDMLKSGNGGGTSCNVGAKNLGRRAVRAEPKSGRRTPPCPPPPAYNIPVYNSLTYESYNFEQDQGFTFMYLWIIVIYQISPPTIYGNVYKTV